MDTELTKDAIPADGNDDIAKALQLKEALDKIGAALPCLIGGSDSPRDAYRYVLENPYEKKRPTLAGFATAYNEARKRLKSAEKYLDGAQGNVYLIFAQNMREKINELNEGITKAKERDDDEMVTELEKAVHEKERLVHEDEVRVGYITQMFKDDLNCTEKLVNFLQETYINNPKVMARLGKKAKGIASKNGLSVLDGVAIPSNKTVNKLYGKKTLPRNARISHENNSPHI